MNFHPVKDGRVKSHIRSSMCINQRFLSYHSLRFSFYARFCKMQSYPNDLYLLSLSWSLPLNL